MAKVSYAATTAMGMVVATGVYLDDIDQSFYRKASVAGGVMLVATVLLSAFAFLQVRSVLKSIGGEPAEAAAIARYVADGDLTHSITAPKESMLGSLAEMQQKLRGIFLEIIASAAEIAKRSEIVATASRQIGAAAHTSRRPGRGSRGAALPWLPMRYGNWLKELAPLRRTSRA